MENEYIISIILSFMSPKDVCRYSILSKVFNSASESDTVWEHFLPSDYEEIVARSASPLTYSSKKQLFFQLTNSPILLDGGILSFQLSKFSGKKCFMICARELQVSWGDTPHYWNWISVPESRFTEVAKLEDVWWLEIRGKIQPEMLSLNTKYAAYLVYKFDHASNFRQPCKALIRFGQADEVRVELNDVVAEATTVYLKQARSQITDVPHAKPRRDGWLGLKLGEFCINQDYDDDLSNVEIMFWEISANWKRGLIMEGIELCPVEEG